MRLVNFGAMLAVLMAFVLGSCVERKETLNIAPNGSVYWRVEHESESLESLYDYDAVPRIAGEWIATQDVQKQGDQEKFRLIAERVFAPGETLPPNFALRTDVDADLYLQFPTTITIEPRADATYYHFSRRYLPRAWASINTLEERLVKHPLRDFAERELHEWTPAQRLMAVQAFIEFETEKMLVFARAAFRIATPKLPQDAWLQVRQHVLDCVEHYDLHALAARLEPREATVEEQEREEAIRAEIKELNDLTADQLKQAMFTIANCSGAQLNAFMMEYDRQVKAYQITSRLATHRFRIAVEMPGEIVASNAESVGGSTANWEFDGSIMRDREFELLATSRIVGHRPRR